jgi:hypothetical protein
MRCSWSLALAVLALPAAARAGDVAITKTSDSVEFKADGQVVARYHVGAAVAKPYLWPVLAPGGVPVTRTWPIEKGAPGDVTTDHVHQKSAWFCHGDVIPEGLELKIKTTEKTGKGVDFWSEAKDKDGTPRHGKITCVKVGEPRQHDRNYASVTTWNEWKTPDGVKILDEERTIHFRDLPAGRLFLFECKLTASVCPISFGDTKEGSFGVRVHDAMRTQVATGGAVTAADGKSAKAPMKDNLPVWGQPADWNDYSGTVDGKAVGIAVFDHPSNPSRAAWHTRAYGLMAANPFGRNGSQFPSQKGNTDLFRIEKGKDATFRYGIYAHAGNASEGKVAEAYEEFKKK